MESNLIIPRVAVFWKGQNITSYTGDGFENEPLVYDVQVNLQMTNTNPTGSFKWNPSGPAYKVYEKFLKDAVKEVIGVKFYYAEGRGIEFAFVWAGHSISYGNDMVVTIKLRSELDGLINGTQRSIAQAPEKPQSYLDAQKKLDQQYGLSQYNMVRYEKKAEEDTAKAKQNHMYQEDQTYGSALANLQQQNGNITFSNNINQANVSVLTPFTWKQATGDVIEPENDPKPNQRYGYLLGPGIISTIERSMEWSPQQQNNQIKSRKQPVTTSPVPKKTETKMEENMQKVTQAQGSTLGTAQANPNTGINNADNPDGPVKQNLLQEESRAKLSASMFVCPSLMGIKPCDIVYVPSLDPSVPSIEDWIVESVDYQQTDGGVEISLSGSRTFGAEKMMNEPAGLKFKKKAMELNKGGLEAWAAYAWATTSSQRTNQESQARFIR